MRGIPYSVKDVDARCAGLTQELGFDCVNLKRKLRDKIIVTRSGFLKLFGNMELLSEQNKKRFHINDQTATRGAPLKSEVLSL